MTKLVAGSRYLIIIPIIGLALAAAVFFVFAGFGLIRFLLEVVFEMMGLVEVNDAKDDIPVAVEVLEYVHTFLIGTVLYITAIGFYQLFVKEVDMPGWLRVESTEDLETNLIGVTVVVLAVNFMGLAFTRGSEVLMQYGIAIALPIAALALFVGLRTWATSAAKKSDRAERDHASKHSPPAETPPASEAGDSSSTSPEDSLT